MTPENAAVEASAVQKEELYSEIPDLQSADPEALAKLADDLSNDGIRAFLAVYPALSKGFRPGAGSGPAIRKKIAAKLRVDGESNEKLLPLLAEASLARRFICVLSEECLEFFRNDFAACFGYEDFRLGLMLDSRPGIRALAEKLMPAEKLHSAEKARRNIEKGMTPFIGLFRQLCPAEKSEAVERKELLQQLRGLEKDLAWHRERVRRLEQERDTLEGESAKLHDRLNVAQAAETETRQKLNGALSDLEQCREQMASELRERDALASAAVDRLLEGVVHSWLQPAVEVSAEVERMQGDDLFARTRSAMEAQARKDRHSGNRYQVRERLNEARHLLEEVRNSLGGAFAQHPDLVQIEKELAAEVERLERLLGEGQEGELAGVLSARIAGAGLDNLEQWADFVSQFQDKGMLSGTAADSVNQALILRLDREMLIAGEAVPAGLREMPSVHLLRLINEGKDCQLILDAHNILLGLDRYARCREQGHAVARERIVKDILRGFGQYSCCRVRIVFDGPVYNMTSVTESITVVYSGGGPDEDHKADRAILDYLREQQAAGKELPTFLVTDDKDFALEAGQAGARIIPLHHFAARLPLD